MENGGPTRLSRDKVPEANPVTTLGFLVAIETKTPHLITKEYIGGVVRTGLGPDCITVDVEPMGPIDVYPEAE